MEHACLPKNRSGLLMTSDVPWTMLGLPKHLLVDNGPDFHGIALARGCSEYGITLSHRPVRQPHFGGHIAVVDDVTTWSLTHFEPVSAWSDAEDLTAVEEREGYGIVGRLRRQCGSGDQSRNGERSLREVTHPKVRGAALWIAHALLASCHGDASDRSSGSTPQERQIARILRSAPAGREWLAHRQEGWPSAYRRQWWIDVRRTSSTEIAPHHVGCDMNC